MGAPGGSGDDDPMSWFRAAADAYGEAGAEDTMRWALDLVCGYTGWPVGHVLTLVPGSDALTSTGVWHNDDENRYGAFVSASDDVTFGRGVGLPGRILASGGPGWIADVRLDPNFPRAALAEVAGIGAGFGFPIISSRGVEGVLEFFAPVAIDPDKRLLLLLSHLGIHLGVMLDRDRLQQAAKRDIVKHEKAENSLRRAQEDLQNQQSVLERIARDEPLEETLDALCRDIERHYDDARCSILLADHTAGVLHHAAAPSLPADVRRAIDGMAIREGSGACGSAAALRRTVVVEDTLTHPDTAAFVPLAIEHGLRSVWSHPLIDGTGAVLGTFAVYWRTPHQPDDEEVRVVVGAGSLAALAIERDRSERALTAAANVDPLTGLPNRARFLDRLTTCLESEAANVAVMFLDLDRFKWINDSLGHPAGDTILVEVASRLSQAVIGDDVLARFGGDEFTVLVVDATPQRVGATAGRIEAAFDAPFILDGGEFFLSVSIGVALNDREADAFTLVRDADTAMYSAKEGGRARRVTFDERLRKRVVARVSLEAELRHAIERDEMVMHYQPIVDVATGLWSGAEALVRWEHPEHGVIWPDDFVPLAEETGLIVPLGVMILDKTIAQAKLWSGAGRRLRITANVSVVQLSDPNIGAQLAAILRRHQLAPDQLVLEVTESAVMEHLDLVRTTLGHIVRLGVQLVIDDFGTGYSSIARLRELPVVGLKIDRSFTSKLGMDEGADDVVAAIVDLAHALKLEVVAEGIETAEALAQLKTVGCDFGQGYFLGRPAPPSTLNAVLNRRPDI